MRTKPTIITADIKKYWFEAELYRWQAERNPNTPIEREAREKCAYYEGMVSGLEMAEIKRCCQKKRRIS